MGLSPAGARGFKSERGTQKFHAVIDITARLPESHELAFSSRAKRLPPLAWAYAKALSVRWRTKLFSLCRNPHPP